MTNELCAWLFNFDALAKIMMGLIAFISLCVGSFAAKYMKGNTQFKTFFMYLGLLAISVSVMVSADYLVTLFVAWSASNMLLVRLMIHKPVWNAAQASGRLALKNYMLGAFCVLAALALFYWATGETSIKALLHHKAESPLILPALALLLIGAMTQSAIWPFHRWLISSLNAPTPVSALMHAGLINGGGFLLVRFAPLYLKHPYFLTVIFIIGTVTALLGTVWKLMQSDVKRMLACSTMGQMGFMLAQCGLGLFPTAVAHLVGHGMFKAYLFLASGGSAQEQPFDLGQPIKPLSFFCSLICGIAGSLSFGYTSGKSWLAGDTTLVMMVVSFIAASQFALPMLGGKVLQRLPLALTAAGVFGLVYGGSVDLIGRALAPMSLMQPQLLNGFHIAGILVMTLAWLFILFMRHFSRTAEAPEWMLKGYVAALNASQPHPATITAQRNQYQYA